MSRSNGGYMLSWRKSPITFILCMTLINTVAGVGDANKPAIVDGDVGSVGSLGESVQLDCQVKNQGNLKVYWRQNFNNNDFIISIGSSIIASNPNSKYYLDVRQNNDSTVTYSLSIRNLSATDAGLYTCALGSTSPPIAVSGILTILGVSKGPLIVYDIGQVEGKVGGSATLRCVVAYKESIPVKWRRVKDNREISSDSTILITNPSINGTKKYTLTTTTQTSGEQFDLTVNKLTTDDGGDFECQARTNPQPYSTKRGTLLVQVPPVISSPNPENITVQIGGRVDLSCTATGAPTPDSIVWQRVNFFDLPNGQQSYKGPSISIVNANKDQRGLYRCRATNNVLPDAEKVFRVLVEFAPTAKASNANVSQAIGFPVTLVCVIEGYPDITPTWYKLQSEGPTKVTNSLTHIVTHTVGDGINGRVATNTFRLRIENLALSDYGDYQCEGVSSLGSSAATIKITESATCEGGGCPIVRPSSSVAKPRETTTCTGDCTGGSETQHYIGHTCVLLVVAIFISLYSNF